MLEDVSINHTAGCANCTPINIPDDELNRLKFNQINAEMPDGSGIKQIK